MRNWLLLVLVGLVAFGLPIRAQAADADLKKELEMLKKEIEDIRKEKATSRPVGTGVVDKMVDNKYGPNATVTTKQGKLTIGGLLQVWYYNIENDNLGFFGDLSGQTAAVTPTPPAALAAASHAPGDTNEGFDNDSYAIRRARVNFTMDIHENVQAYIQMDLANSFSGNTVRANSAVSLRSPTLATANTDGNVYRNPLIDAYIKVHGLVPHHDSMMGMFQPQVGLEGVQSSSTLDFCERSMIGILTSGRDVGSQLHGTWMDDRIQYWLGVFNTPGSFLEGGSTQENRADNNDLKSGLISALFRPVWKNETWGSLELGVSAQFNITGEAGEPDGTDGLNMTNTDNQRYYAYATYAPGGPVKGWWLKGEYAYIRGRLQSSLWTPVGEVMQADANLTTNPGVGPVLPWVNHLQNGPRAFDTDGWYVSTGYKLSDSIWSDDLPWWLKPAEFTFRYQTYGNIQVADLSPALQEERHEVWNTSIYTAGMNYYIKGHNAKIQVNYNWVTEPDQAHDGGHHGRQLREVNNDNLVVNFQVAW